VSDLGEIRRKRRHMLIEGVPITTKAAFKAACGKKGKTMRGVLIGFMRYYANAAFKKKKDEEES
jgi:hypothetical protein